MIVRGSPKYRQRRPNPVPSDKSAVEQINWLHICGVETGQDEGEKLGNGERCVHLKGPGIQNKAAVMCLVLMKIAGEEGEKPCKKKSGGSDIRPILIR
jgi:hypothetical protein